ncbi:hypothetical protein HKD37_08G022968 [Glycine soja]
MVVSLFLTHLLEVASPITFPASLSAAIDLQEANDSIDEEDPRPTSSTMEPHYQGTSSPNDKKKNFKLKDKKGLISTWEGLKDISSFEENEEANFYPMADRVSEESESDQDDEENLEDPKGVLLELKKVTQLTYHKRSSQSKDLKFGSSSPAFGINKAKKF